MSWFTVGSTHHSKEVGSGSAYPRQSPRFAEGKRDWALTDPVVSGRRLCRWFSQCSLDERKRIISREKTEEDVSFSES
jgi:hypothetical protein